MLPSPAKDQASLQDVMQKMGVLTTALATTNTKVDKLTKCETPQMATQAKQPGPRHPSTMENFPLNASVAEPYQVDVEEQVRLWVTHCIRATHISLGHHSR